MMMNATSITATTSIGLSRKKNSFAFNEPVNYTLYRITNQFKPSFSRTLDLDDALHAHAANYSASSFKNCIRNNC
jgi:hypothetical protein